MIERIASASLVLTICLTAFALGSCHSQRKPLTKLSDQLETPGCDQLRGLLRSTGGGAVDIYEDDYAAFIRGSSRYGKFKHIPMDELVAIRAYTHRFWQELNAALWQNKLDALPEVERVVLRCAVAGLNRLDTDDRVVYRQTNLPQTALDRHLPGAKIRYPAFTSTTTDASTLKAFPGNTRFTIEQGRGYAIAWLSEHPNEAEVLIPPGRCFEVVSRSSSICPAGISGPCWQISLKGLDDSACDGA